MLRSGCSIKASSEPQPNSSSTELVEAMKNLTSSKEIISMIFQFKYKSLYDYLVLLNIIIVYGTLMFYYIELKNI